MPERTLGAHGQLLSDAHQTMPNWTSADWQAELDRIQEAEHHGRISSLDAQLRRGHATAMQRQARHRPGPPPREGQ